MSTPVIAATPRWLRAIPVALAFSGLLIPVATGVVNGQPRTAARSNDALYQSGCGYFDQGNYSAAEDAFRRLAALEPGNPRAIEGIVEVFLRQNASTTPSIWRSQKWTRIPRRRSCASF